METYTMVAACTNCSEEWIEEIPKGTLIEDHHTSCKNCGCRDIRYRQKAYDFENTRKRD